MILFKQADSLNNHLAQLQQQGKSIGFVPTMGALHPGHLSLLTIAQNQADITVCSIFINPTQFTNPEDFKKYPITLEQDIALLTEVGCDVLFLPSTEEIYPDGYPKKKYNLDYLETILEGKYRPGHFQGVCQVVDRLLEIVHPDRLILGQKDYQQCMVIQALLTETGRHKVTLVLAPTLREEDGLAMSSRNLRLTSSQRALAPALYKALTAVKSNFNKSFIDQLTQQAQSELETQGFRVDYFEVADATTLCPVTESTQSFVAVVAAYLGEIRLIDNLSLN